MAWEALVEAHSAQAREFVALFEEQLPLDEALTRYVRDMDLSETMVAAVRTRVLVAIEDAQAPSATESLTLRPDAGIEMPGDDDRWRRFRPDVMMRGVIQRQRKNEEVDRLVNTYSAGCNERQQTLFRDSLHAALTVDEMRALVAELGFDPETVEVTSDRHWTWNARPT